MLPLGKWIVGRPIMRSLRNFFRRIPLFSICVRGAVREDRMMGFCPEGKKGSAAKVAAAKKSEDGAPGSPGSPVYIDVYTEERETGHPHLYTSSAMPGGSFEGEAVHRAARTGDVRSGIGPF